MEEFEQTKSCLWHLVMVIFTQKYNYSVVTEVTVQNTEMKTQPNISALVDVTVYKATNKQQIYVCGLRWLSLNTHQQNSLGGAFRDQGTVNQGL